MPRDEIAALRQEVATLDSELPIYGVKTMPSVREAIRDVALTALRSRLLADICRSLPNKPVDMAIDGSGNVILFGFVYLWLYPGLGASAGSLWTSPRRLAPRRRSPRPTSSTRRAARTRSP